MKVISVVGARPNFMKVAPLHRAFEQAGFDSMIVHTGQHYDEKMSDIFFQQLELPEPDLHLGVGSGSHAEQTARVMTAFEPVIEGIAEEHRLVFPIHPRTRNRFAEFGMQDRLEAVEQLTLTEPLGYLEFLRLMEGAGVVVTDSGGIQEETVAV